MAAYLFSKRVSKIDIQSGGTAAEIAKLRSISGAIADGAMAFLNRQYFFVGLFAAAFALFMALVLDDSATSDVHEGGFSALAFLGGALFLVFALTWG